MCRTHFICECCAKCRPPPHLRLPSSWPGRPCQTPPNHVLLVMPFRRNGRRPRQYQRSPPKGDFRSQERSPWTCPTGSGRRPADACWPPSGQPPSARTRPGSMRTASRSTSPRHRPGSRAMALSPALLSALPTHACAGGSPLPHSLTSARPAICSGCCWSPEPAAPAAEGRLFYSPVV